MKTSVKRAVILLSVAVFMFAIGTVTPLHGALSRVKVWGNEILTASDLNNEFNNVLSNALALISPLTGNLAAGGNDITGLDELALNDAAANASAAGRIRRNSTNLTYHDGTAARNLVTSVYNGAVAINTTSAPVSDAKLQVVGHIHSTGTTPTVGSCGTSPSVSGTDQGGQITTGSTATTSCVMTFGTAWGVAPACVASGVNTPINNSSTTTALTVIYSNNVSLLINYICMGRG